MNVPDWVHVWSAGFGHGLHKFFSHSDAGYKKMTVLVDVSELGVDVECLSKLAEFS